MGAAPMAGPKFDPPDLGPNSGVPRICRGADFQGPTATRRIAPGPENRLHGQTRSRKKRISSESEAWAPLFGTKPGQRNCSPAMDDRHARHPVESYTRTHQIDIGQTWSYSLSRSSPEAKDNAAYTRIPHCGGTQNARTRLCMSIRVNGRPRRRATSQSLYTPNLVEFLGLVEVGPNSAQIDQSWPNSAKLHPEFGQNWSEAARIWPKSVKAGQTGRGCGSSRTKLPRRTATSGTHMGASVQREANLPAWGQHPRTQDAPGLGCPGG